MKQARGVIAAGHPITVEAGAQILAAGGNAFDAVIAAAMAACVAEPLLASLAGGGFLTAREANGSLRVFDFFAQTPRQRNPAAELVPIEGDFGGATQEFHIGMGATATPGVVDGLWSIHAALANVPLRELARPAIDAARGGVEVNDFQAYIARILRPIVTYQAPVRALFGDEHPVAAGDRQHFADFADCLDALCAEGSELFYHGEIGAAIAELAQTHGGHLTPADLACYRTEQRPPLTTQFAGAQVHTNPLPACGGTLIAHALHVLQQLNPDWRDQATLIEATVSAMAVTNLARRQSQLQLEPSHERAQRMFDQTLLDQLLAEVQQRPLATRGTTQISVADRAGNLASLTLSNGEGNGYLVPGTDIHLNNFLGEQDLSPAGIGQWSADQRISSMMSPTVVASDRHWLALGSGGSNRLRSAILQVLANHLAGGDGLAEAIERPRLHLESGLLSVEPGLGSAAMSRLAQLPYRHEFWQRLNVFFGGVHAVAAGPDGFVGHGDSRRGGSARVV